MTLLARMTAAAVVSISFTAAGQNLIQNPDFDEDLTGWQLAGDPLPEWSDIDAGDAATSGSARLFNAESVPDSDVEVMSQCLVIGPGEYSWGVRAFIPAGQATEGSVVVRVRGYSGSTDCTGNVFTISGRLGDALDQWQPIAGETSVTDSQLVGPEGSIEYIVAVRKSQDQGQFEAFADQAFFGPPALVFEDRFEVP